MGSRNSDLVPTGVESVYGGYCAVMHTDDLGAPPSCANRLVPMLLTGTTAAPYWRCPSCDLVGMV